jgi:hypothetical protein
MKKLFAIVIILSVIGFMAQTHPTGAQADVAGTPAFPNTCATVSGCHSDGTNALRSGWITSNVPVSGYVAGTTYTITATATQVGQVVFGFEISPQDNAGNLLGTLIITNSTQTQIVSSKYVTHKQGGITGPDSHTWSFDWTAPAAGTGSVTFYGSFLCGNGDQSELNDDVYKSSLTITEDAAVGILENSQAPTISVFPNPASDVIHVQLAKLGQVNQVEIVDITGRNSLYLMNITSNDFQIPVSSFAKGIYIMKFYIGTEMYSRKIVID